MWSKKMKVLLCQPASNIMKNRMEGKPALPPLGLMYIASTLRENGYNEVKILDVLAEGYFNETSFKKDYIRYGLSPKQIKDKIKEFNPDIVGVSCMVSLRKYHAYEVCKLAKEVNKNITTIIGGNHITCFPKEALRRKYIDYAVLGEGEKPFLELVDNISCKSMYKLIEEIDGAGYRTITGKYVIQPQKEWKHNIDEIPFPAHDLIDLDLYESIWKKTGYQTYEARKFTMSMMARGCPNKCISGETLVNTVEGKIPIKDLVDREKIGVYTYDPETKEHFITDAVDIRKTGINEEVVRVNFDDGTHIDCTPNHEFLVFKNACGSAEVPMREIPTKAINLKKGERIRALREEIRKDGYCVVYCGSRRKDRKIIIMEYLLHRKLKRPECVHHIDKNRLNDLPCNLMFCKDYKEHARQHPENYEWMTGKTNPHKYCSAESYKKIGLASKNRVRTLNERIKHRISMIKVHKKKGTFVDGKSKIKEINDNIPNHKILSIEKLNKKIDVYNLEVPSTHWFFANDVLVHNCNHCPHDVLFPGYRYRSAINLFNEIKEAHKLGVREIMYMEYNGIVNWNIIKEFCELMISSGLNKEIRWGWPIGIWLKVLTRDRLKLMREAGMDYVCLAIESYDQKKLDNIMKGKDVDLSHVQNVIKWCNEFKYQIHGFFMLGLEGQSKQDIENTINYAKSLDIQTASFFIAQPLPGTVFWDYCKKNKLFYDDFDTFQLRYGKSNHKVTGLTATELEEYRHKGRAEFIKSHANSYQRIKENAK